MVVVVGVPSFAANESILPSRPMVVLEVVAVAVSGGRGVTDRDDDGNGELLPCPCPCPWLWLSGTINITFSTSNICTLGNRGN